MRKNANIDCENKRLMYIVIILQFINEKNSKGFFRVEVIISLKLLLKVDILNSFEMKVVFSIK